MRPHLQYANLRRRRAFTSAAACVLRHHDEPASAAGVRRLARNWRRIAGRMVGDLVLYAPPFAPTAHAYRVNP